MQAFLLALALVAPGVAQAALGVCAHAGAPAAAQQAQASAEDCHNMAAAPDAGHHEPSQEPDDDGSCCAAGMSCAPALALPGASADPAVLPARSPPVGAAVRAYLSHVSLPDYPPPRG